MIGGGEVVLSAPASGDGGRHQPATPCRRRNARGSQTLLVDGSAVAVDGRRRAFSSAGWRHADLHRPSSSQTSVATVNASGSHGHGHARSPRAGRSSPSRRPTRVSSNSSVTQRFTVTVGKDYDSDGDGLIEIRDAGPARRDPPRPEMAVGVPGDPVRYTPSRSRIPLTTWAARSGGCSGIRVGGGPGL